MKMWVLVILKVPIAKQPERMANIMHIQPRPLASNGIIPVHTSKKYALHDIQKKP